MFKKYYEYLMVLGMATLLTAVLYAFLSRINEPENTKPRIQIGLENASHRWNDLFYRNHSEKPPHADVAVLAIDEPSVIEIGRWPWSRNVINQITQQLLRYDVKTIAYDIIFSEKESDAADTAFAATIAQAPEKMTFGTFSDYASHLQPYQDFCLTQAFLYTGGAELVKINPYFSVDDESNSFEEIEFNQLFQPIFTDIDRQSESTYLKFYELKSLQQLSQYQLNTLNFFKQQKVYEYCSTWLTADDPFNLQDIPEIKNIYYRIFAVKDDATLNEKIHNLKSSTLLNPIPQYEMWKQNIPSIQQASQYTASFVASPDPDGIIRNYPLIFRTGNQLGTSYIPSLALQSYLAATGYQALFKVTSSRKRKIIEQIEITDVSEDPARTVTKLPVNFEGKMLVNYYGQQNTIPYISAKELLNSSPKMEYSVRIPGANGEFIVEKHTVQKTDFLKAKNIIFGATAIGIYDIRTTPNDINYPGPEIHASMLANLLSNDYLRYYHDELQYAPLLFFALITITLLAFMRLGIPAASALFLLIAAAFLTGQHKLYSSGILLHSSFLFFNLLFFAFFIILIYKYFFQSRKSKEIKMAFSKYVSKDVVEEILKNESAIELRGQKLHMSVYFSDIRGFTSFSEKMDPVELSELLNRYFTPMSAIITRHQGTIDKYIGDAVMAMFGAPINHPNHALQACHAALGCVAALEQINTEFAARNWPKIDIGIGINTGYMNAGNIGSETIQNYTVIGDSVNLASRLESLTKNYGVRIIISEFTFEIVKDTFECRELDKVNVKGKAEPVRIYELLSVKSAQ